MNHDQSIKLIIVDDEVLAREKIRDVVKLDADFHILAECTNGAEAIESCRRHSPDLLLLDIQMPEIGGFEVLEKLQLANNSHPLPHVIFVTAFDKYAVQAFEVHALDYLLKPFDRARLQAALEHAKRQIRDATTEALDARLLTLLKQLKPGASHVERLVVKNGGRIFFLHTNDIEWIEAEGNYVNIHTSHRAHLLRETLNRIEAQLDPKNFVRIHRSTIVNLAYVKELHSWTHGEFRVILRNGTELTLSRNFRERLQEMIGNSL